MIHWNDLKNLHVIKQTKNIIYKWWKVDVLIVNEQSITDHPSDFKETFQNPLIQEIFQWEPAREAFFKTLKFVYTQKHQNVSGFFEKWPNTGLNLFITPIKGHSHMTGFIIAAGFLSSEENQERETAKQQWSDMGIPHKWYSNNNKDYIPFVSKVDRNHFIDLMEIMASEIASVQKEFTEKNQQMSEILNSYNLSYGGMVGKSKVMHQLYNLLDKIKHSQNTILIQGENGTGKELIAKSIHQNSLRKNQAFIIQNCSALNDNLLESELFGHVKGAFTGAYKDKKGLFELADKGSFFLDEVGDTSPTMQVKLLRVIQEGTFFPVGGTEPKKVDVRIIAATNKDLKKLVEDGTFREDLYYRLNVINIQVPPLRERAEDIALLADFFINRFSQQPKILTKKALERLSQYAWPGNVRELQNEAERLAVFTGSDTYIKEEALSEKIRNKDNQLPFGSFLNTNNSGKTMKKAIAQLERQMISQCLKQEGWNKTKVAKKLGISRAALVSKVKDYKLERRSFKSNESALRKKSSV